MDRSSRRRLFILWLVIAIAVVIVVAVAALALRRSPAKPAAPSAPQPSIDREARQVRHQVVDRLGSELIDRRVELDARRNTLGGDEFLDASLARLEERRRAGDITESEYEREKVRLLEG